MTTVLRPALVWKEVRGLGSTWLTAAALLVAVGFVETGLDTVLDVQQPRAGRQLTVLFYVGACALLGALSIGQEFTDRTLAGLLAQPAARSSVLLHKLGAVAAMLLALGGLAWAYGLTPLAVARAWPDLSPTGRVLVTVLPVLGGVLLTPCLTLLTRSALAGCVLTIALSLAMVIGSRVAVPWLYGDAATLAQANARFLDIFVHTMLAVVVLSALLMWRLFMRLEAIEGRGLELHLPAWLFKPRVHLAAARSVWQQMLGKELHLQEITFVVSGLYVAAWLAVVLVGESLFPTRRAGYMTLATLLHAGAIPLLAGSLASAEERQLGTLGWQVLLPIAAWRQWAVKAAVVLVLSLGLAIGVPAILYALFASGPGPVRLGWPPAAAIAAVATVSLYASSLSTNGVRALVAIVGVVFVATITMNVMPSWMPLAWDLPNAAWAVLYAASAAVFAWLLWLGMKNHGSAERGAKRVLKQVAALGAVAVVAMLAFAAAARAEVLAPRRNFDERIRTRVAFEVEERGLVGLVPGREMVAAAFVREGSSALDLTRDLSVDPDPEQLRAAAATVRPRAGETTTVRLELTRLPSAAEAAGGRTEQLLARSQSRPNETGKCRAAPSSRTERAFPSHFRDARGAKVRRLLRGATRTPTNWAERVDWHGACSAPHTAEGEPR